MATVNVRICDICGSQDDVQSVSLKWDGGEGNPDLCVVDRQPIIDLAQGRRPGGVRASRTPGRRSAATASRRPATGAATRFTKVATIEEIEASKTKGRGGKK